MRSISLRERKETGGLGGIEPPCKQYFTNDLRGLAENLSAGRNRSPIQEWMFSSLRDVTNFLYLRMTIELANCQDRLGGDES